MSALKRHEIFEQILLEQEMETRPLISGIVKNRSSNRQFIWGRWDSMSNQFELAFVELWDLARADNSKHLDSPLLFLWRHSVELAIKSAISYLEKGLTIKLSHNLVKLFERLVETTTQLGLSCDDDHTRDVEAMIKEFYSIDPYADRFRYPQSTKGSFHECVEIDLEKLFKAHCLILGWCRGVEVEIETGRINGLCE